MSAQQLLDQLVSDTIAGTDAIRVEGIDEMDLGTKIEKISSVFPRFGTILQSHSAAAGRYADDAGRTFDAFLAVPKDGEEYAQAWFGSPPLSEANSRSDAWLALPEIFADLLESTYSKLLLGGDAGGFEPPLQNLQDFFEEVPEWWTDVFPAAKGLHIVLRGAGGLAPYICVDAATGGAFSVNPFAETPVTPVSLLSAIDDYMTQTVEEFEA